MVFGACGGSIDSGVTGVIRHLDTCPLYKHDNPKLFMTRLDLYRAVEY